MKWYIILEYIEIERWQICKRMWQKVKRMWRRRWRSWGRWWRSKRRECDWTLCFLDLLKWNHFSIWRKACCVIVTQIHSSHFLPHDVLSLSSKSSLSLSFSLSSSLIRMKVMQGYWRWKRTTKARWRPWKLTLWHGQRYRLDIWWRYQWYVIFGSK